MSLNEKERLKEKAEDDARQKARDKERLARKAPEPKVYEITLKNATLPGLPPPVVKTNSLALKLDSSGTSIVTAHAALPSGDPDADEDPAPPEVDPTLDETESILVDYLHVLDKVVTAKK